MTKDLKDLLGHLFHSACQWEKIKRNAGEIMEYTVKKYIYYLQGGDDKFLSFDDFTGFPIFRDFDAGDILRNIFGARCKAVQDENGKTDYVLYVYAGDTPYDEMGNNPDGSWNDGWFEPALYGDLDMYALLGICLNYQKMVLEGNDNI